eukprot:NODE_5_length_72347_cov_1.339331.p34 type:complete len:252 gc:universal NODE_5_length_72347_cov_1.339331:66537-67292(+)
MSAVNLSRLIRKYKLGKQITMVTAWDSMTAQFIEKSRVDCLLVGDSLAMTALGHESTVPLGLDEMIHHTKAVARAAKRPFIISDIPFSSMNNIIDSAIQLMKCGANSVKLEGVHENIKKMVSLGIPCLGHIGLNPQHVNQLGGYKVYRNEDIIEQAKLLQSFGCWGIVLEAVPSSIAKKVQSSVDIPLVGIGAGKLDGQVLVFPDLLGLSTSVPKFCRVMAKAGEEIDTGLENFCESVESLNFPAEEEEYK